MSTQLIVIVCLSRQKTRPGRKHTLPYDGDDDDDADDDDDDDNDDDDNDVDDDWFIGDDKSKETKQFIGDSLVFQPYTSTNVKHTYIVFFQYTISVCLPFVEVYSWKTRLSPRLKEILSVYVKIY